VPPTPPTCNACLKIYKFHDLDEDGIRDPDEPMLEGVAFDIVEGSDVHHRVTDASGVIEICFPRSTLVLVSEQPRQSGGRWYTTTPYVSAQFLACSGVTDLWIGNAEVGIPETGGGGMARKVGTLGLETLRGSAAP
jgi:hypothetical protein